MPKHRDLNLSFRSFQWMDKFVTTAANFLFCSQDEQLNQSNYVPAHSHVSTPATQFSIFSHPCRELNSLRRILIKIKWESCTDTEWDDNVSIHLFTCVLWGRHTIPCKTYSVHRLLRRAYATVTTALTRVEISLRSFVLWAWKEKKTWEEVDYWLEFHSRLTATKRRILWHNSIETS